MAKQGVLVLRGEWRADTSESGDGEEREDIADLRKTFNEKLEEKRKEIPQLPEVAMGYAIYNGDGYATQKEADDNMYKDKKSVSKNL